MRILYLIKGLGLGGAEKHVAQLAQAFALQGHEVCVAYLLDYKDAWVAPLRAAGIHVECVGGGRAWPVRTPYRLTRLLTKFKPDVVHAHLPVSGAYARILKPVIRYRLVYTEHNEFGRLHAATKRAHAWTRAMDDVAISCSQAVANSLSWSSRVIDNGIDDPRPPAQPSLRERHNIPRNALIFLCVANMTPKKNHAMLLRAFDTAVEQCKQDIRLVLVGQDATEGAALRELARGLKHTDSVTFWGAHPQATDLMFESDVFVLASLHEGLPISLLEAMSVGLPCLVSRAGGMADVVGDDCGVVIDVADAEQLTDAIVELASDAETRQSMGKQAKLRIQNNYSQKRMVEEISDAYSPAH